MGKGVGQSITKMAVIQEQYDILLAEVKSLQKENEEKNALLREMTMLSSWRMVRLRESY